MGPTVEILPLPCSSSDGMYALQTTPALCRCNAHSGSAKAATDFCPHLLESYTMPTSPSATRHLRSSPSTAPQPAPEPQRLMRGGENRGLMFFFIGAAVVALMLVVFFNVFGPERAARSGIGDGPSQSSAGATTGGPSPSERSTAAPPTQGGGAASGGGGAANPAATAPQAPDSQTPAGREGVGAPRGAAPERGTAQDLGPSAPDVTSRPPQAR